MVILLMTAAVEEAEERRHKLSKATVIPSSSCCIWVEGKIGHEFWRPLYPVQHMQIYDYMYIFAEEASSLNGTCFLVIRYHQPVYASLPG